MIFTGFNISQISSKIYVNIGFAIVKKSISLVKRTPRDNRGQQNNRTYFTFSSEHIHLSFFVNLTYQAPDSMPDLMEPASMKFAGPWKSLLNA